MIETCEIGLVKYILVAFNFIFAISGLGLIIAGSILTSDLSEYNRFLETRLISLPILFIIVGLAVFLVAALGIMAVLQESIQLLTLFAACLIIIFIVELTVGIVAAVFRNEFESLLKENLKESLSRYSSSKMDKVSWEIMQIKLDCCGVDGPDDWVQFRPYSCCRQIREGSGFPSNFHCNTAFLNETDILYQDGCFDKLKTIAKDGATTIMGVGIGIAFLEVIGVMLACWLAYALKHQRDVRK